MAVLLEDPRPAAGRRRQPVTIGGPGRRRPWSPACHGTAESGPPRRDVPKPFSHDRSFSLCAAGGPNPR